jgi:NAD+ synthase (glutamine-hydrolysing)
MPVLFGGARYNCRVLARDRRILLIRPKVAMADNGNYRESRYFTAYRGMKGRLEDMVLPAIFRQKFGQTSAAFGTQYVQFGDGVTVGCESCEELWTPQATHIELALLGVEIIGNGSGSHHELRKLNQRLDLIVSATRKCGGVYLYANQRGCDGGRLYYDGGALIACNGKILAQAKQFSLDDVQVITATIDLDDVRSYRASIPSFGIQTVMSLQQHQRSFVNCPDHHLLATDILLSPTTPLESLNVHCPEEECCLGEFTS